MKSILELIQYVIETNNAALFIGNLVDPKSKIYFYTAKKPYRLPIVTKEDLDIYEIFHNKGYWGYIKLDYEFAYKIYNVVDVSSDDNYFVFDELKHWEVITSEEIDLRPIYEQYPIKINYANTINQDEFMKKIRELKSIIEQGYTYQINYTEKIRFDFEGELENFIMNLIFNQSTNYTAIINNGDEIIISLSPELFFEIEGQKIKTSPMKGTKKRGYSFETDKKQKEKLAKSEKNQAENIMIVDLLRNDLNKICKSNSVEVENLFTIEKYETVYQMTSTIKGKLDKDTRFSEVIESLFPCGSVTGAPKAMTIFLISRFEETERGIYTGAIGLLTDKKIVFNVPIRTLVINKNTKSGELGVGSGIIYTCNPSEEYFEVLLKAKFIENSHKFYLIETILLENGEYTFLKEHLERLEKTSNFFLFRYDKESIKEKLLDTVKKYPDGKYKVRINLYKYGHLKIDVEPIEYEEKEYFKVLLYPKKIFSKNREFNFKTSIRDMYNEGYEYAKSKGYDEVIFMNNKDQITEGSFTNIFYKKDDNWYTPALECGLLNGIYRKYWLENGAQEKITTLDDLLNADEIVLTNSVRGKIKAKLFVEENN